MSWWTRIVNGVKSITLEPFVLLFTFTEALVRPTTAALFYQKLCVWSYHNMTICANLTTGNYPEEEIEVQKLVARWLFYDMLCFFLPAILMTLLYGSWGDLYGRKLVMVVPMLGMTISTLVYLLNALYMDSNPAYILIGPFISGLTGGRMTCSSAIYSYVTDITTIENRAVKISIIEAVQMISVAVSSFCGGIFLESTSFLVVYGVGMLLCAAAIAYVICVLPVPTNPTASHLTLDRDVGSSNEQKRKERVFAANEYKKEVIVKINKRKLFDIRHITESLRCIMRKRNRNGRCHVLVTMGVLFLLVFGASASADTYLFLKHPPLGWSQKLYGYFNGFSGLVSVFCLLVLVPIAKKVLHTRDTTLIIVGITFFTIEEIYFGLCRFTWMVFLVPVIGILDSTGLVGLRSLISQLVEKDEQGKLYAAIFALDSISALLAAPFYQFWLYPSTVSFFPGLSFIVGGIFIFLSLLLHIWLHRDLKKLDQYKVFKDEAAPDDADCGYDLTTDANETSSKAIKDMTSSTTAVTPTMTSLQPILLQDPHSEHTYI